jgi:hypothetical protein
MQVTDEATRAAFLQRLATATEASQVKWEVSKAAPNWYVADVLPFSYVIHSVDKDDRPPFEFKVFKYLPDEDPSEGTSNLLEVWSWDIFGAGTLNPFLEKVYVEAKRQVLGLAHLEEDMFASLARVDGGSVEPEALNLEAGND